MLTKQHHLYIYKKQYPNVSSEKKEQIKFNTFQRRICAFLFPGEHSINIKCSKINLQFVDGSAHESFNKVWIWLINIEAHLR